MSPLLAVGDTACPADSADEETASLAAEMPDATPAIVAPTLRKSRRVVFIFPSLMNSPRRCSFELAPSSSSTTHLLSDRLGRLIVIDLETSPGLAHWHHL